MRYKVWAVVEQLDDDTGNSEDCSQPLCLFTADTYGPADRFLRALATLFDPESNDDYAYPVETFDEDLNKVDSDAPPA